MIAVHVAVDRFPPDVVLYAVRVPYSVVHHPGDVAQTVILRRQLSQSLRGEGDRGELIVARSRI